MPKSRGSRASDRRQHSNREVFGKIKEVEGRLLGPRTEQLVSVSVPCSPFSFNSAFPFLWLIPIALGCACLLFTYACYLTLKLFCNHVISFIIEWEAPWRQKDYLTHIFIFNNILYRRKFFKKRKKKEETLPECVLCIRQMQDVSRWKDTITNLSSLPDFWISPEFIQNRQI